MMPLTLATLGQPAVIRKIIGKDDLRRHLAELGLVVESEVTVMNRMGDNLILQVKDCRIALDRSLAMRIRI